MPRKYSVEFKEKTVHQIIEMVRLESCSLQRAYEQVGELRECLMVCVWESIPHKEISQNDYCGTTRLGR